MRITEPQSETAFEAYFELRHQVLRAPWGKQKGTERDELEKTSVHAAALNAENETIGAARLHIRPDSKGQIRYMAVAKLHQGKGVGKRVLTYLEGKAKIMGLSTLILNARQNAIPFYLSCGYKIVAEGELLWGQIPHKVMEKEL